MKHSQREVPQGNSIETLLHPKPLLGHSFNLAIEISGKNDGSVHFNLLFPDSPGNCLVGPELSWNQVEEIFFWMANNMRVFHRELSLFDKPDFLEDAYEQTVIDISGARKEWAALREKLAPKVFHIYGKICQHCGTKDDLTIDHIVPIARGGTNELWNLQPLCKSCNSSKGHYGEIS